MRLERLGPLEVKNYFKENKTIIIPTGSIEGHGVHNVLGVDSLAVDKLVLLIEDKCEALIAPTVSYGVCDNLLGYHGSVSIGYDIYYKLMERLSDEFWRMGATRFVFLNGHGGNNVALANVCGRIYKKGGLGAILNWWIISKDLNPEWNIGHGGAGETSAMLAIDPSLVKMELIDDMNLQNDIKGFETVGMGTVSFEGVTVQIPRDAASHAENGWVGSDHPKHSTAELGKEMLHANADYICKFVKQFEKV